MYPCKTDKSWHSNVCKDDKLQFKLGKTAFGIQVNDRFQQDEVNAVLTYLAKPEIVVTKR